MDHNNHPFNHNQNSSFYPINYNNPIDLEDDQNENPSFNQPPPQNTPNYWHPSVMSNFMHPPMANYMNPAMQNFAQPYYGMQSQPPTQNRTARTMRNENVVVSPTAGYPRYSTQVPQRTPDGEGSSSGKKRCSNWSTAQDLVLLSAYIRFGTDIIVGNNQRGESFWTKIAAYCNEHGGFDAPRDRGACRNRHNYINKFLGKWVGCYAKAERMKASGWSDADVLAQAQALFFSDQGQNFNYIAQWKHVRYEPRYASALEVNTGSDSSGSKRGRDSDGDDSGSIGSIPRPMGREAAKKKGKSKKKEKASRLEAVVEDMSDFKIIKTKEVEQLEKIANNQANAIKSIDKKTRAKNMSTWLQLRQMDDLDDQMKELFDMLTAELFMQK